MDIQRWMDVAMEEAKKSEISEWSMGAVIVRGSKVLGSGYNRFSGHVDVIRKRFAFNEEDLWSLHAEMDALMSVDDEEDLHGAVMFVSGFKSKNGNPICCKPCKCCSKILKHNPIDVVYYADHGEIKVLIMS